MNHGNWNGVRRAVVPGWIGTLVLGLAMASPLRADVLATTDYSEWSANAEGDVTTEDFNSVAQDDEYRTKTVAMPLFNFRQSGTNYMGDFRNLVDVHPFLFTDNNGTPHASNYVNAPEPDNGLAGTSVVVGLTGGTTAFGGDIFETGLGEGLTWLVTLGGGQGTVAVDVPGSGFFGVYATNGDFISKIEFVATERFDGAGGQGFGFDNAVIAVPEPAGLVAVALSMLLGLRPKR